MTTAPPFASDLHALAEDVALQWSAAGGTVEAFADIAVAALERSNLARTLTIDALCRYVANADTLPVQLDPASTFGEPPVTLAIADGFHIDAYLWVQPATAIHDHGFDGAFQVVDGVSLHSTFTFDGDDDLDAAVRCGTLSVEDNELLGPGTIRSIRSGQSFIHQVAHLPTPSLSLVVRTTDTIQTGHQYEYLFPGVAVASSHGLTVVERRQLEVVSWAMRLGRPDHETLVTALVTKARPLLTAWLLRWVAGAGGAPALAARAAGASPYPWVGPLLDGAAREPTGRFLFDPDPASRLRWVAHHIGLNPTRIAELATELDRLRSTAAPPRRFT